jgi:hypothetical protein
MLDTFGMQQGGSQYRRLLGAFQRVFGATIFFGTDTQHERAVVIHRGRFNFMREAWIWYSHNARLDSLLSGFENVVVLSDEFYHEIMDHRIPADLEAVKVLSSSPAALYVAFLPLFLSQRSRAHPVVRRLRAVEPAWECKVHAAAEVP